MRLTRHDSGDAMTREWFVAKPPVDDSWFPVGAMFDDILPLPGIGDAP